MKWAEIKNTLLLFITMMLILAVMSFGVAVGNLLFPVRLP